MVVFAALDEASKKSLAMLLYQLRNEELLGNLLESCLQIYLVVQRTPSQQMCKKSDWPTRHTFEFSEPA